MLRTTRTSRHLLSTLLAVLLLTGGALAQARLDFFHPVAGGTMEIVVDHVPPDAEVLLAVGGPAGAVPLDRQRADASGTARFGYAVPPAVAGERIEFVASIAGDEAVSGATTIDRPQLLVTVTADARGSARLLRVALEESGRAVSLLASSDLGDGVPGGAVRDGQRTKTFVVADRVRGRLAVVPDDPEGIVTFHPLAPDVRDIALTPDGRYVLVTSAREAGREGVLALFDARTEQPVAHLVLEPLGENGGRTVVSEDGLRAFVAVEGLYLLEVDLLRRARGGLVGVGGPGQDEIKDLRLVDGRLFALTGRSDAVGYVTALDVDDLRRPQLAGPSRAHPRLGVADVGGDPALLLLDGAQGMLTVLDAATLARRDTFAVPAGARALLFSPNASRSSGALLYPRDGGTLGLLVDFTTATLGKERLFGDTLSPVPVHGRSSRIDLFFAVDAAGTLVPLDPDTLEPLAVVADLVDARVEGLSVAD